MERNFSTDLIGKNFDKVTIDAVWEKAKIITNDLKDFARTDMCGTYIYKKEYGNTITQYGWEIDHIKPISMGGTDALENLQPLQWKNNRRKAENYPWTC